MKAIPIPCLVSPVVTGETREDQFLYGEIIIVDTDNNNVQVEMNNTLKNTTMFLKKQRSLLKWTKLH